MRALDCDRRVTAVPCQKPGVSPVAGLSAEQCEEVASWAVEPGGTPGKPRCRYRGAAINASLAVALGVRLPLSFYGLPSVGRLQELLYDFAAANRHRLPGGVPYCKQCPEERR